jgi:hypothetical protein
MSTWFLGKGSSMFPGDTGLGSPAEMPIMPSPIARLLGPAFACLPGPVQKVHALRHPLQANGQADIDVAAHALARLICRLAGLPASGRDVPVSVLFKPDGRGGEYWERRFGPRRYASVLVANVGQGRLIEHFGPFRLQFRLTPRADGLEWSLAGWRLGVLPLPSWSAPRIECLEHAQGDRFAFDIHVSFPLIGWVINYRGSLGLHASPGHDQSTRRAAGECDIGCLD